MLSVEALVRRQSMLGEGPLWDHRTGVVMWVDILASLVHRTDPVTGETVTFQPDRHVGAVALRGETGYMLALRNAFAPLDHDTVGPAEEIFTDPDVRMNDGAVDPVGRFLAGTMADDTAPGRGHLYSRHVDGTVTELLGGVTISNGIDWSDDGETMYYVDTPTQGVDVFDYDLSTGSLAGRRRHVTIPEEDGSPDGIAIDAEGCLWVALYGGGRVRRFSPSGAELEDIEVPASQVTSCAFGGAGLDRLFITTAGDQLDLGAPENLLAGSLFVVDPGCRGRKANVIPDPRASEGEDVF
jgi:sugar lactone lactonase YvrE